MTLERGLERINRLSRQHPHLKDAADSAMENAMLSSRLGEVGDVNSDSYWELFVTTFWDAVSNNDLWGLIRSLESH